MRAVTSGAAEPMRTREQIAVARREEDKRLGVIDRLRDKYNDYREGTLTDNQIYFVYEQSGMNEAKAEAEIDRRLAIIQAKRIQRMQGAVG